MAAGCKPMTCKGCEARREWIKQQTERAKQRMQLCLQQLTGRANQTEQSVNSDQQRAERTDQ